MKADYMRRLEGRVDYATYWVNENGGWYVDDAFCNEHDLRWFCKRLQPLYDRKLMWRIYLPTPDMCRHGAIGFEDFFPEERE